MDTLERALTPPSDLSHYTGAPDTRKGGPSSPPSPMPTSPYFRAPLPSAITGGDSLRQFYSTNVGGSRLMQPATQATNATAGSANALARDMAMRLDASLTTAQVPGTADYPRITARDYESFINPAVFKGLWAADVTYFEGNQVSWNDFLWVATGVNVNSMPARSNVEWEILSPLTLQNFKGAWSAGVTYYAGDEVSYIGYVWQAVATNTASAPSSVNTNWRVVAPATLSSWKGAWASGTAYNPGDEVSFSGYVWQALQASTNQTPATGSAYWVQLSPSNLQNYKGVWSSGASYLPGDEVLQGSYYYQCILANINQVPPNATYWVLIGTQVNNISGGQTTTSTYTPSSISGSAYTSSGTPVTVSGAGNSTLATNFVSDTAGATYLYWCVFNSNLTGTSASIAFTLLVDGVSTGHSWSAGVNGTSLLVSSPLFFVAAAFSGSGHHFDVIATVAGGPSVLVQAATFSIGVTKA